MKKILLNVIIPARLRRGQTAQRCQKRHGGVTGIFHQTRSFRIVLT